MPSIDVESDITKVIVFNQDRAQVFRTTTLPELAAGDHTVLFNGLWKAVDRATLQVSIGSKNSSKVTLHCVQFNTVTTTEDVRPLRAAMDERLAALGVDLALLQDKLQLRQKHIQSYEQVRAKVLGAEATTTTATGDGAQQQPSVRYDTATWAKMQAFVVQGIRKHTAEKRVVEKAIAKVERHAAAEARSKAALGYGDEKVTSRDIAEVQVNLSEACADVVLQISYLVRNASWSPVYDLRVNNSSKTMSMSYNAMVHQATGEDWEDVALELSTAKPNVSGDVPEFRPWTVKPHNPYGYGYNEYSNDECVQLQEQCQQLSSRSSAPPQMMQQMMPSQSQMTNMMTAPAPPPPPAQRFSAAASSGATVSTQTTATTFAVAASATILADDQPVKVSIATVPFNLFYRYSVVPKLDPKVYLKVKTVNNTDYLFLGGKANVFADGQLVSTTRLETVAPGEEFWTFLGTDDDITLARTAKPKKKSEVGGGLLSSKRNRHDYEFVYTARNKKLTDEELVLWDQYPAPNDKRLVVVPVCPPKGATHTPCQMLPSKVVDAAVAPTPAAVAASTTKGQLIHKTNADDFIEWFVPLKGNGDSTTFAFSFGVEFPQDVGVVMV